MDSLVRRFAGRKILIVGDIIADEYISGTSSRISREAPVLVLKFHSEHVRPGGAGNAAANVSSLGGTPLLVGVLGQDRVGDEVRQWFTHAGISTDYLLTRDGAETTRKTRIMAGGHHTSKQQVIRIDRDQSPEIDRELESEICDRLEHLLPEADGVIISDYGHGVLAERVRRSALDLAVHHRKVVCVDSRHDIRSFRGATLATPNEEEMEEACGHPVDRDDDLRRGGQSLRKELALDALIVTRGRLGLTLFESSGNVEHYPIYGSDEVADVTGAGDTVAAVAALSLGAGGSFREAAYLANLAGGIVVMKRGAATLSPAELLAATEAAERWDERTE
ncbi:hypothetical protein AMJ39_06210 [candidate division TA06 bacterium DG_24]|uniref:Carbohydrate kinase PfkB domain-containing protein n=3 Tax=Bacteria division TA06 TaxID=1156500 RepID=A0A0S8JN21_UNCT6|nr:MAG: hypothetical protein AMJ39_06210 [candidate division TA06 bacterium DG_24]KPK69798.1 MAG: hypothetical protein AMJ82_04715 [candidate division TA06 bacterium SM23_40]KPL10181.1 MAG: hypothetical protein AMJ71_04150 [candidate division TA06 bacterium SM1_40]